MKKTSKRRSLHGAVLGGPAYDAIARVEGLSLSNAALQRVSAATRNGETTEQARRVIRATYSSGPKKYSGAPKKR